MKKYQVIVGNIGTVVDTDDLYQAVKDFHAYVEKSNKGEGRGADEPVTFMRDGEVWVDRAPKEDRS